MALSIGSWFGLLALLGIPVLVAIHMLHRQRKRVRISTLFLLPPKAVQSHGGARWERLVTDPLFWLRVLLILLFLWLLLDPRWPLSQSTLQSVIILDDSAGMEPFRDRVGEEVRRVTAEQRKLARNIEWVLLESSGRSGSLYSGSERDDLLQALDEWRPLSLSHDIEPTIDRVLRQAEGRGLATLITNRRMETPRNGLRTIGVGAPVENWSITPVLLEGRGDSWQWSAYIQNHGAEESTRTWWWETGDRRGEPRELTLPAGGARLIRGALPPELGEETFWLRLDPDDFPLDDEVAMVRPRDRELAVSLDLSSGSITGLIDILLAIPGLRVVDEDPDISITARPPGQGTMGTAVVWVMTEDLSTARPVPGVVVPSDSPLVQRISWDGLEVGSSGSPDLEPVDQVLLWKGDFPIMFTREATDASQLWLNFDVRVGNAFRLTGLPLVLYRWIEEVRDSLPGTRSGNFVAGQAHRLVWEPDGPWPILVTGDGESALARSAAHRWRVPDRPGVWEVRQGEELLLRGTSQFSDPRISGFLEMESFDDNRWGEHELSRLRDSVRADSPWWYLLIAGLILATWLRAGRGGNS